MLKKTLLAVPLTAALAIGVTAPAGAAGGSLKHGVYDCEAYNAATGFLDYRGSVKLLSGGRYQWSTARHAAKLTKPHKGKYHVKSGWIKFTGVLKKSPGKITKASSTRSAFFSFYVHGQSQHEACYYVANP